MSTTPESQQKQDPRETLTDKASDFVDRKGTRVGEALETVGGKISETKTGMEEGYSERVSPVIDRTEDRVNSASRYLQKNSAGQYCRDLELFARNHLRLTVGLSMLLGWKIGRAFKSSR